MSTQIIAHSQEISPRVELRGQLVDSATRCIHYHSQLDIIAIKFRCCEIYYPCYKCHEELAGHPIKRWTREELDRENQWIILCGDCHKQLSFSEYSSSSTRKPDGESSMMCIHCLSQFNPKCSLHYDLYFDL
ncbi:CHY zinc finger-domain-containing protein [Scheffersomyces xylosifermentans]|uniref:CHY zinc finger-domain-containing protein n=1 Tax=Scheffersomyces xylosifermentans TaxID=1304137 RepID=UPI00315CC839